MTLVNGLTLARRLHNAGWARILNCTPGPIWWRGLAEVETRGPRWLGQILAIYAIRHSRLCCADYTGIEIVTTHRAERWRYHWQLRYTRI